MTHFTRCMFCVVANKENCARGQLQAALLKEINNLHKSIEQRILTLEARMEEMVHARSDEANHQRTGTAIEDLC